MKKILTLSIITAVSALMITSCTEELTSGTDTAPVKIESVTMLAQDFKMDGPQSKTSLAIDEKLGAKFSWSADDIVGVFPDIKEASQVKFPIKDGNVSEGSATSSANFTGNGWAVMEANKYMSYYPFKPDMNLLMTAIPVIYTGQSQVLNNNPIRICLYDYMAAAPTKPSLNGHIGFKFKHMNSLLVLDLIVPKPGKYTSLTLTCDEVPFVTEGTLDITSCDPAVKATVTDRSLTLNLGGIDIDANEKLRAFMMIAPMNAEGKTIKVRLQGPNADFNTSFIGKNYLAGLAYKPGIEVVKGGDVIQLEEGTKFNEDIKSLVNGEHYILDKKDYKIKNVVFQANSDGTVPSLPYVDVSSTESSTPIYASWDASTGTVYVSSPSYKVYSNSNAGFMFKNLKCLEKVSLGDFSTDYTECLWSLFDGCERIQSVDMSSFDLSLVNNASALFAGCENLTEIAWPNMTFSKTRPVDVSSIFNGCKLLTNIDLHCLDDCKVNNFCEAFSTCKNLKSIDISKIDFSSCGGYIATFRNCSSLITLDVSNFGWKNVSGECVWTFEGCTSLKEINLGDFYIPKARRLDSIFENCSSLEKMDYTRFDINAETYENFFCGCTSLRSINVDHMVTSLTRNIRGVFWNCKSLENIDLSHWNTSSVTVMSVLFTECAKLETIDLSSFETYNVTDMGSLFRDCTNLKKITFGDGFNTEKVTEMGTMFSRCSSIEVIDVSKFSTPKVIHFNGMFDNCSSLKEIIWGDKFDTHYAEDFGGMFGGCSSLENLDLSWFNMSSSRNINGMFTGCTNLKKLDISSFTSEHIENNMIHSLFMGCDNLAELRMGRQFNPTKFYQAFGGVASKIDGKCNIYCSETFMNNFSKDSYAYWNFDPRKATWINCETEEIMTFPQAN